MGTVKAFVVALAAFVGAGCSQPAPQGPPPVPDVLVIETKTQDVPIYAEFVGTLDGDVNAEIRARVPGYVTGVHYTEGRPVKAGQLLFTIDPVLAQASVTQAQGQLETAKAALAKADIDVNRLKPLAASSAVSKQELDNAIAARESALAQVTTAQGFLDTGKANLGYTRVTSPIEGIAGVANVRIGNLVGMGEPTLLTTVSRLDPIRARFTISEQLYIRLASMLQQIYTAPADRAGTLELILVDGTVYPQKGKVTLIDRQIDVSTGTISLTALFPNPENLLRPGQFAKVRGATEVRKGVVVIPQRAVRELQGVTQVMVVGDGNKVEVRPVTMGPRVGSNWVVEGGLKPGERVVIEGLQKVKSGMVVAPEVAPAGSAAPAPAPAASAGVR